MINRQDKHPVDVSLLRRVAEFVLEDEKYDEMGVNLAILDAAGMEDLNVRFTGREGPTDVLAFPMGESGCLGDVALCADVAADEASARGKPFMHELALYAVHGILHLIGYDDHDEFDRENMYRREREILEHFGIGVDRED